MSIPAATAPRVSVCMATWNGAPFLGEQVRSILEQLAATDELVIVDDASSDGTVDLIGSLGDPRIRLTARAENRGYVRTFEEALSAARGTYLLLADQDDVWLPGRVAAMTAALDATDVVATNLSTLGGPDALAGPFGRADWRLRHRDSGRRLRNVAGILAGAVPYYGCAMGVRRDALGRGLLPFPPFLHESHDLWIALYGNLVGTMTHLGRRTVARRLHGSNEAPARPRGGRGVVAARRLLLRCIGVLLARRVARG